MRVDFDWSWFLISQLWTLPYLVIYIVGIVLSAIFWKRHTIVSILCLIAFLIFLGMLIVGSSVQFWQMTAIRRGVSTSEIASVSGISSSFHIICSIIAWILLLTAMFGWRSTAKSR